MSDFVQTDVTTDKYANLRKVLFGNQRQASHVNEAVVKIVARHLLEVNSQASLDMEFDIVESIEAALQNMVNARDALTEKDLDFIRLVAGEHSVTVLQDVGPVVVNLWQPNPESPKWRFAIAPLGTNPADSEVDTLNQKVSGPIITGGSDDIDTSFDRNNPVEVAEHLKDSILKTAPTAIVETFGSNDYAAALYLYESWLAATGAFN